MRVVYLSLAMLLVIMSTASALQLNNLYGSEPKEQLIITRTEDWEEYINVNYDKSHNGWVIDISLDDSLRNNITNCLSKGGANRITCLNALEADFNISTRWRTISGNLTSYPITKMTSNIDVNASSLNLLNRKAVIRLWNPSGFEKDQSIKIGFNSINITTVLSDELLFTDSNTLGSYDLPSAVNTSRAIITHTARGNSTTLSAAGAFGCNWFNSSRVNCQRRSGQSGSTGYVRLQVLDFSNSDDIIVYNFTKLMSSIDEFNFTYGLTPNISQTFYWGSGISSSFTTITAGGFPGIYINTTSIHIRYSASSASNGNVTGQVVWINNSVVQQGSFLIPNLTKIYNLSLNTFNVSKTAVFFTVMSFDAQNARSIALESFITNSTGVRFSRSDNSGILNVSYWVVEFPDNTSVYQYNVNSTGNVLNENISITQVDINRSVSMTPFVGSYGNSLGQIVSTTGNQFRSMLFTSNLTTSTLLEFQKNSTSAPLNSVNITFQVIEFGTPYATSSNNPPASPSSIIIFGLNSIITMGQNGRIMI